MKITRRQLIRLLNESLNEEKKSYPPLKLSDMKNVGDKNKDITMEAIRSSMKSTFAIDNAMANKYPDTKASGNFVVEDYVKEPNIKKTIAGKYNFNLRKSDMFAPTVNGKKYYVMMEKVFIHPNDRND